MRLIRTKIATCGLAETKKKKKGGRRKSQNRYISPPRGGAISRPICNKFGEFVDLVIITLAKFGSKILIGFSRLRGDKTHFPFRNQTAYTTVPCTTALACDHGIKRQNVEDVFKAFLALKMPTFDVELTTLISHRLVTSVRRRC